jgi:hypothetical protein
MSRTSSLSSALALAAVLGLGFGAGCGTAADDSASGQREALLAACHLDDGTVEADADLRACDPHDTKKTTICHIPPGNPGNAHTICVGNPAVAPHVHHHGDTIGPCKQEVTCQPPAAGTGGAPGGSGDTGGAPGGHVDGTGGAPGGTSGGGGSIVIP